MHGQDIYFAGRTAAKWTQGVDARCEGRITVKWTKGADAGSPGVKEGLKWTQGADAGCVDAGCTGMVRNTLHLSPGTSETSSVPPIGILALIVKAGAEGRPGFSGL